MPPFKKGKITQDELISQICELYHVEDYGSKINYSLAVKKYQPEKKAAIVSDIFSTVLYIIGEDGIDAEKIEEIRQSVSAKSYIDDETWDMVEKAFRGVVVGVNAAVAADYYGNVGKVESGSSSITNILKKSTCNNDELYKYISKNVSSDAAEIFLKTGKWPDGLQVPKNSSALNVDGKAYSYAERSLPYVEDSANYHQYEVIGDFTKIEEYVNNCTNIKLKTQIEARVKKYYKGDYSRLISYRGKAASVDGWGTGGATQYELSLSVEQLEGIGQLKEIK